MRGTLRWARADLSAGKAQALISVLVVAGVVAALVLATMLLEGAVNPWKALSARTHGADLVVYFSSGTDTGRLGRAQGIADKAGPYQTAPATLDQRPVRSPVQLTAMTSQLPRFDVPLLVAGSWLRDSAPDGAVVEASFAAATGLRLGQRITVRSVVDGQPRTISVIGIADSTDQGFYPQWTPGLIWVPERVLEAVEPSAKLREELLDVRLAPGSDSRLVVQQIYDTYNSPDANSVMQRYATARQVQDSMASNDRLVGLLLALFGLIALVAAPCAIANVTAGRVLMHRQDLAMLKALGFTPAQVVRMLLAEQAGLGVIGALAGVGLARVITAPQFIRPPGGASVGLAPLPASWVTLITAGTVGTVVVATAIPAWWAGRISPVSAVRASPPRGHLSPVARIGLLVHLPAPLVLGARDSLTRRLPAILTIAGVAIPMLMITIALTTWSTIDGFGRDPARIGLAAELTVRPGSYSQQQAGPLISAVGTGYQGAAFDTVLPGGTGTYTALAIGTSDRPYPFHLEQGWLYRSPYEAVAGQGFLDLMHESVGSMISVPVNGVFVSVRIVGTIVDPEDNGDVLAFGMDTLATQGNAAQPQFWSVVLRSGLSPGAARDMLLRQSGDQLDVQIVANPADRLGVIRLVIAVSVAVVAIIGLASLLTATAIGVRDHRHETGVLAAIGLTPRQVTATLVVNTTILTAIGVAAGIGAGMLVAPSLINRQAQASGVGSGIAAPPSPLMVLAITGAALLIATTAALTLARRTRSSWTHNDSARTVSRQP